MKTVGVKNKEKTAFEAMKGSFGYKSSMQAPKLVKVAISVGVGSFKDKKKIDLVVDRLAKISGQHSVRKGAKKSVASFKIRQGDPVGCQVTLRGERMYGFLDKLINTALPRAKDFRGVPISAIDKMGNITIGVREHTVFPETSDEDIRDVFGLAVTAVTTAKNDKEGEVFFRHLGFPLRKAKK